MLRLCKRPRIGKISRPRCTDQARLATVAEGASDTPLPEASGSSATWTPESIRTGLIAVKRGMTSLWDDQGVRHAVTVLQIENCQILKNITTPLKGGTEYHAVQVAASDKLERRTSKSMQGIFRGAGLPNKKIVREFMVTPDAHCTVGASLSAAHFVPGQFVDVIGKSIGKGFQGVMKRWGFKGQGASHGNSKAHRLPGGIGANQDPGKVWPGKKMAGHMGNERVTAQNLLVMRIDLINNLIYLKGCVPGHRNGQLLVKDAKKKMEHIARHMNVKGRTDRILPKGVDALPFPAGTSELANDLPPIIQTPSRRTSPFLPRQ